MRKKYTSERKRIMRREEKRERNHVKSFKCIWSKAITSLKTFSHVQA